MGSKIKVSQAEQPDWQNKPARGRGRGRGGFGGSSRGGGMGGGGGMPGGDPGDWECRSYVRFALH